MNPITRLKCAVRDIMRDVLNNRKRRAQTTHRVSRVIVSCSVGGLSLTQGDEHGEGLEEEPRGEAAGGVIGVARRVVHTGNSTASTSSEVISETSMSARRSARALSANCSRICRRPSTTARASRSPARTPRRNSAQRRRVAAAAGEFAVLEGHLAGLGERRVRVAAQADVATLGAHGAPPDPLLGLRRADASVQAVLVAVLSGQCGTADKRGGQLLHRLDVPLCPSLSVRIDPW